MAKAVLELKIRLLLCDRNRNFDEIIKSIMEAIRIRDGIDDFQVLEESFKLK